MSKLSEIQNVIQSLVSSAQSLPLPPLGPGFRTLASNELHEALVRYRMINKFEAPDTSAAGPRREISIMEVVTSEKEAPVDFDYRRISNRRDFLLARSWLSDFFSDFRHGYGSRFPSGETYVSSGGRTDLYFKLTQEAQWSISPDLVAYAVEIILRDRGLASVVKDRFRSMYEDRGLHLLRKISKRVIADGGNVYRVRFESFRFMLRACCTLNRVSRVTTVPKNNRRDRVITCESLWNMICQLSFAQSLRHHMRRKLGIVLEYTQDVHRALIRSGASTIDFRKASDTNYMCVLKSLWPTKPYKDLERMRTGIFELIGDDGDVSYLPLRMFAPMGCGCTFEVMTLTLLALARVSDPGASVFGDDVITRNPTRFCDLVAELGWIVNTEKSFVDGPFRESCGSFCDLRTNSFLLSYDFWWPASLADCEILYRKMWNLAQSLPPGRLRVILVSHMVQVLRLLPSDAYQVHDGLVGLNCSYVPIPRTLSIARSVPSSTVAGLLSGYYHREVQVRQLSTVCITRQPIKVACRAAIYCYLRRGSSYEPQIGEKQMVVPTDSWTGTPIRDVLLASVLH